MSFSVAQEPSGEQEYHKIINLTKKLRLLNFMVIINKMQIYYWGIALRARKIELRIKFFR